MEVGPRVLVTGSSLSGKSTLCQILVNYTLKLGWTPLFCDIDLGFNEIGPPGTLTCSLVEEPLPNDDLVHNSISFF